MKMFFIYGSLVRGLALWMVCAGVGVGWMAAGRNSSETEPVVAVHAATLRKKTLRAYVTGYGIIQAQPATAGRPPANVLVAAAIPGLVRALAAVEGQTVERDDVLVRLDSRQADAAVRRAEATFKQTRANHQRQQKLSEVDDTSRKAFEQAEQQLALAKAALSEAKTVRGFCDIRSPLKGIVVRLFVRPGEAVSMGAAVADIVNLDRLIAEVQVPQAALSKIRSGQLAVVRCLENEFRGTVYFVGARVNPLTGAVPVRIALPAGSGLRPGQFARAGITVEEHPGVLAAPLTAVIQGPGSSGRIARIQGDRATMIAVRTGLTDGGWIEVSGGGLRAGDQVVSREVYGLLEETRVTVTRDAQP